MDNNLSGGLLHLFITGVMGFLYFLLGQFIYPLLTESIWQPFGISLYFLLFAGAMYVTMFVLNQVRRDYSFWVTHAREDVWHDAYRRGLLCVLVVFVLAGVFEFVYELGKVRLDPPSSYIFVIDDSGSMGGSDPHQKRSIAINTIMSKQDASFPYAVYGFTTEAQLIKGMASYSSDDSFTFSSDGGTDVLKALDEVLTDLADGTLSGAGASPRILLLSDGESSSFGWQHIAADSRSNNVVISSIGFGYDSGLLRNIAERTGGVFVQVDSIDELPDEMEVAINSTGSRNLISSRVVTNFDWLYAVMRVLFLSVIGVAWSLLKFNTYCSASGRLNERVLLMSLVWCTVSSIVVEIAFQVFWIAPAVVRMVFCILWALTPGFFAVDKHANVRPQYERDVLFSLDSNGDGNVNRLSSGNSKKQAVFRLKDLGNADTGLRGKESTHQENPFTSSVTRDSSEGDSWAPNPFSDDNPFK